MICICSSSEGKRIAKKSAGRKNRNDRKAHLKVTHASHVAARSLPKSFVLQPPVLPVAVACVTLTAGQLGQSSRVSAHLPYLLRLAPRTHFIIQSSCNISQSHTEGIYCSTHNFSIAFGAGSAPYVVIVVVVVARQLSLSLTICLRVFLPVCRPVACLSWLFEAIVQFPPCPVPAPAQRQLHLLSFCQCFYFMQKLSMFLVVVAVAVVVVASQHEIVNNICSCCSLPTTLCVPPPA